MLTRRRSGLTLAELVISLAVAGIVLGLLTAIGVREQRVFSDLADRAALAGQLREAAAILPIDVRALSPATGDIRVASDTAIELRGTIASGVVCDTASGSLVVSPPVGDSGALYATALSAVSPGDTLWLLTASDSAADWQAFAVASASSARAGPCASAGPRLAPAILTRPRGRLTLVGSIPGRAVGSPFRVTRALRYSVYRATDAAWYLGERDWNSVLLRFNTIQPVAGPLLAASAGGVRFAYRDSAGSDLATPVVNTAAIRLIDIMLRGQTRIATRILGARADTGVRRDSAHVVIAPRNR
ncbi:MAG: prepilin-type N-terminal cleavage/methylation domain-containing protein [Gemmatimonadales bacterium]